MMGIDDENGSGDGVGSAEDFSRRFSIPGGMTPDRTRGERLTLGQGSGFFILADGYAVNAHVVDTAEGAEIMTQGGKIYIAGVSALVRRPTSPSSRSTSVPISTLSNSPTAYRAWATGCARSGIRSVSEEPSLPELFPPATATSAQALTMTSSRSTRRLMLATPAVRPSMSR
jgi:hypothetical protein